MFVTTPGMDNFDCTKMNAHFKKFTACLQEGLIHECTIGYPLGEEIIEPEAEVVDSESIRSGNVLVQSTHPGPQPRPQGIST